jgi:acyl-CoA synthetase (AMP-forming)/AMP-acid ligase II
MPQNSWGSLWDSLSATGHQSDCFLWGADASVTLTDLAWGSSLDGRSGELRGRSVLVLTRDQLTTALALIELDGIARRLVLCPPDLRFEHVPYVIATAEVDALVSDQVVPEVANAGVECVVTCSSSIAPVDSDRSGDHQTEWILFSSGTTGLPKMILHTLSSLAGAIESGSRTSVLWSTFYDIRRYGGLQIFLRALLGGGSLVLSSSEESTGDFLVRAGAHGVTHISGTPSHWRNALTSPSAHRIAPQYIRLSGEIADQPILDGLRAFYPDAKIAHAFASTEAGVAFEVGDGLAGFPASLIGHTNASVEMKVEDGSLRIRSARNAVRYLGSASEPLADKDGFVDTRDMLELRGDRYYFVGRRDGIINVGGLKVHPEEIEAVINRHPRVQMSRARARKNPFTGAVVVADVVAKGEPGRVDATAGIEALKSEVLETCRRALAPHKVPAAIYVVPSLNVAASGKLARPDG